MRYNLVLTQLVLFVAGCVFTFIWEWNNNPWHEVIQPVTGILHLSNNFISGFTCACVRYFSANAPVILFLWSIFFIARTVKVMGGLVYVSRARHRNVYSVDDEWKQKIASLCERLQLYKAVTLFESGYVKMPLVIGHFKPVILMPLGMLTGLPANQVEAVLLHELAHIRRNDYFINLLQHVTEAMFFFNPAVLWISSLLRDEREHCCDDIAIGQTKNKKAFIEALISFKEHNLNTSAYTVAFPGKKDHLLHRVSRILNNRNNTLNAGEKLFCMSGVLVLTLILSAAGVMEIKTTIVRQPQKIRIIKQTIIKKEPAPPTIVKVTKRTVTKEVVESADDEAIQADKDHAEAVIYRRASDMLRIEAEKERAQADRDRRRADRDRRQADLQRVQADLDRAQADRDRAQADRDREQAERDRRNNY